MVKKPAIRENCFGELFKCFYRSGDYLLIIGESAFSPPGVFLHIPDLTSIHYRDHLHDHPIRL